MIIEICATSIESILNAQNAGAHRLELCENYSVGGVTPSEQLIHEAIKSFIIANKCIDKTQRR